MSRELEVAERRREDAHNRDVVLAWHAVAIYFDAVNKGRVPDVHGWLSADTPTTPRVQSTGQHRAALEILSAQYGIPLRRARKES